MSELILYNYFRSSTSYRVRIALHWKKLDFEYIPVHLLNNGGEQNSDSYKKLNAQSEVPTLVHKTASGERVIAQSLAIMEYLEENFPQNSYLPKDSYQKAQIRQFCENINSFIHPLSNLKVLQWLEKNEGFDQVKKDAWTQHWITKGMTVLESMVSLHGGECAFGNEITMADFCLAPQIFSARRFKVDIAKFPRIKALEEKYNNLMPFQKAHPFKQIDTPKEEK